ncbi:MAG: hypothetical protein QRY72_03520 [Candidatus Rhabdochlamydia sp.]
MNCNHIEYLKNLIPSQSPRTASYFHQAVEVENASAFTRCQSTLGAVCSSTGNSILYLTSIITHIFFSKKFLHSVRAMDLTEVKRDIFLCFKNSFNSLHFAAALTCYVALSLFKHSSHTDQHTASQTSSSPVLHPFSPSIEIPPSEVVQNLSHETPQNLEHHELTGSSQSPVLQDMNDPHPSHSSQDIGLQTLLSETPSSSVEELVHEQAVELTPSSAKRHSSLKEQKYEDYFNQIKRHLLDRKKYNTDYIERYASNPRNPQRLTDVCALIIDLIKTNSIDTNQKYEAFVMLLREGKKLFSPSESFVIEKNFINNLSYFRFAGIDMDDYCQQLVEKVSNRFETPLSLENFWEEFQRRNVLIDALPPEETISSAERSLQKLKGFFNVYFDPLCTGDNIPYVYGTLEIASKNVQILRHGVPLFHSDFFGNFNRFLRSSSSGETIEINGDYLAFIEQAGAHRQNILHIILENTTPQALGDESARAKARMKLQEYPHFYPLALSLDGTFFNAQPYHDEEARITLFQKKFVDEMVSLTSEFRISGKIVNQYQDQRGFQNMLANCLSDVASTYFSTTTHFISPSERKAFILLSYVCITRRLLEDLNISILEALCKDDIDRGGAFKAIFLLDHHYRQNTLSPSVLQEIMIKLIAAPLIVKKQQVVSSRASLVEAVLDVMKKLPSRPLEMSSS